MRRALLALTLGLALPVGGLPLGSLSVACAAGSSAAIHVIFDDGRDISRCVPIEDGVTTGIDALRATGIPVTMEEFPGAGSLVCAISGVGSRFPNEACVPPCPNGRCVFWAYLTRSPDGSWDFSSIGASARTLRDGDSDAWVFGSHTTSSVDRDPVTDDEVCARGVQVAQRTTGGGFPLQGFAAFALAGAFAIGATRRMRRGRSA